MSKIKPKAEYLAPWMIGREITDIQYKNGILAIVLDSGDVMICYTEVMGKGTTEKEKRRKHDHN